MRSRRVSGRGRDWMEHLKRFCHGYRVHTVEPVIVLVVFPELGHNLVRVSGTLVPNHPFVDHRISPREKGHAKH
jgi:hypothetical protein